MRYSGPNASGYAREVVILAEMETQGYNVTEEARELAEDFGIALEVVLADIADVREGV